MSPEQTLAEQLDTRSDLFSLGVVLYEMATGSRPFTGPTNAALMDAIRQESAFPARDLNTGVPDELNRIIEKALEKNRKLRYQTASDMCADLRRLKRDLDASELPMNRPRATATAVEPDPAATPAGTPRSTVRAVRVAQLVCAAALGGCLVALGLPLLLKGRASSPRTGADAQHHTAPQITALADATAEARRVEAPAVLPAPTPPPSPPPPPAAVIAPAPLASITEQLRVADRREALGLYDEAIETLRDAIKSDATSSAAPTAYLRMAALYEMRGDLNRAIAVYADLATQYPDDSRAPEALYAVAGAMLRSKRDDRDTEARRAYTDVAIRYPQSPWAARALMGRADLEERRRLKEVDSSRSANWFRPRCCRTARSSTGIRRAPNASTRSGGRPRCISTSSASTSLPARWRSSANVIPPAPTTAGSWLASSTKSASMTWAGRAPPMRRFRLHRPGGGTRRNGLGRPSNFGLGNWRLFRAESLLESSFHGEVMMKRFAGRLLVTAFVTMVASAAQAQGTKETTFEPTVGQAGKDVVWVPTPQALVDKMLDMAKVTPQDFLMDLGSGDGRTVITAAKRGLRAQGVEYNPDMVDPGQVQRHRRGVGDKAHFVRGDIFETDFSKATVITLFLLPTLNSSCVRQF